MQGSRANSAARRRAEEQLERLDAVDPERAVSAIKPTTDSTARVHVRVGRDRFGPVMQELIADAGVRVGEPLSVESRGVLAEAICIEAARTDALRLLGARARSKRDLTMRLLRKGHERAHAATAVDRLEGVGLLDDESLARDRAERIASEGRSGPRGAEVKLRSVGIDPRTASRAVTEAFRGVDTLEQAVALAQRRERSIPAGLDAPTRKRRLYGYLARRGYDHDTCRRAVERALGGADDDTTE